MNEEIIESVSLQNIFGRFKYSKWYLVFKYITNSLWCCVKIRIFSFFHRLRYIVVQEREKNKIVWHFRLKKYIKRISGARTVFLTNYTGRLMQFDVYFILTRRFNRDRTSDETVQQQNSCYWPNSFVISYCMDNFKKRMKKFLTQNE